MLLLCNTDCNMLQLGQIWFQVNFDLILVRSQFPLFPSSNSLKKLGLGDKEEFYNTAGVAMSQFCNIRYVVFIV